MPEVLCLLNKISARQEHFMIGVNFDADESLEVAANTQQDESDGIPGGIIGFCLQYTQIV